MVDTWQRTSIKTIRHASGQWQIAKYASAPTYCLFDLRGTHAVFVACGNDLEKLKGKPNERDGST